MKVKSTGTNTEILQRKNIKRTKKDQFTEKTDHVLSKKNLFGC